MCYRQEVVAICCSWCQQAYHARTPCFQMEQIDEVCSMGEFSNVIIPPSWIIKISRRVSSLLYYTHHIIICVCICMYVQRCKYTIIVCSYTCIKSGELVLHQRVKISEAGGIMITFERQKLGSNPLSKKGKISQN